jgi:hypothetical protein
MFAQMIGHSAAALAIATVLLGAAAALVTPDMLPVVATAGVIMLATGLRMLIT